MALFVSAKTRMPLSEEAKSQACADQSKVTFDVGLFQFRELQRSSGAYNREVSLPPPTLEQLDKLNRVDATKGKITYGAECVLGVGLGTVAI